MKAVHITSTWVMMVGEVDLEAVSDEVMGELYSAFDEPSHPMRDVRVHVQPMPGEYSRHMIESNRAKEMIEKDQDRSFSLVDHVSGGGGVTHPWDQGLNIFPADHPLAPMERRAREQNDEQTIAELGAAAPKLKELPSGSE